MALLVLGNAGWDVVCPVAHLPRPGETLVTTGHRRAPGGKGLNQAVVAARAGAAVTLVAPIGADAAATDLVRRLAHERLRFEPVPQPEDTDQSLLMVAPDGENSILSFGACADALAAAQAEAIADRLAPGDWLLLQGNLSLPATHAALRRARARGARTMLNPAPLRWQVAALLPLCDVLVANTVEAFDITGQRGDVAARALHVAGVAHAIVTLGAAGCAIADARGQPPSQGRARHRGGHHRRR
jgi:ribokinase